MSDRYRPVSDADVQPEEPRIIRTGKPEEGDPRGDGWTAVRSMLLLIGGMLVFSYLIFT